MKHPVPERQSFLEATGRWPDRSPPVPADLSGWQCEGSARVPKQLPLVSSTTPRLQAFRVRSAGKPEYPPHRPPKTALLSKKRGDGPRRSAPPSY